MDDTEREAWIDNDDGLYCLWRASHMSKRAFIRLRRRHIDDIIASILSRGTRPSTAPFTRMAGTHGGNND